MQYFNSALLLDPTGKIVASYSKQHLVPFGEYVPLRELLFFLAPLVENVGDFTAGTSSRPLALGKHLQLGVLICFESIFPEIARNEVAAGANLLVNLTNDACYRRTSAPYQSMAMSVIRALETKRSLVRAANTGISAFVDPAGNIIKKTDIFVPGTITAQVPVLEKGTAFLRFGYRFGAACFAFIPVLLFVRKRQ
jgi:apolipoprotein N-acyltransferase